MCYIGLDGARGVGKRGATGPQQPFRRVRADHARETAEDYTELILELGGEGGHVRQSELARRLGVSHVTVLRVVDRLQGEGLVERVRGRGLRLTDAGRQLALRTRRRHELVERFLVWLGVPPEVAAADAEGIEHHVSEPTLARMRAAVEGGGGVGRGRSSQAAAGAVLRWAGNEEVTDV